jgi:hypothetical protein
MNQAGLEGRKKDSSGRSPEIRETMNESPERAKDTGKFLLFRPCRSSCYDDCPAIYLTAFQAGIQNPATQK